MLVRHVLYHFDSVEIMMVEGRTFLVNLDDQKGGSGEYSTGEKSGKKSKKRDTW